MVHKRTLPVMLNLVLIILTLAACTSGQPIFVGLDGAARTPTPVDTPTPAPTPSPTPIPPPFSLRTSENYLLLGTDRRPDWTSWRTDTIMVIGIDRTYGRAAVLSIPRDLYVEIPGYGHGRINQADYIGERQSEGSGPALVSQVISNTLGIRIGHWARFELKGFKSMVDTLGGVTVHLDCPFYELVYDLDEQQYVYYTLPAGDVLMDGQTAYFYVTLRYLETDFGRSRRQRQFLWALRNQALNTALLTQWPELWSTFRENFSTDLSILQALDLATFAISLSPDNVRAAALTNQELERYFTPQGADVMRIGDPAKVQALIDNIWEAPSLADTNHHTPDTCPPPPEGAPVNTQQLPVPEPTPTASDSSLATGG